LVNSLKDKYAVVGAGKTRLGKLPGRSSYSLNVEAIKNALDDAGLNVSDVDAVLCKYPTSSFESLYASKIAHLLGIEPNVAATIDQAGASNIGMIQYAMMAIDAGLCNVVVCSYGDNPLTGSRAVYQRSRSEGAPYGFFGAPASYAMIARRHMEEYGTTGDQLAAITIACRKHGALNEDSHVKKPVSLDDYRKSPYIVEPLRLLDCCLISDGGAAVVVTSADRARDLRKPPVYISGIGQSHPSSELTHRKNMTTSGAKRSGEMAFNMAGVRPNDMDFAQIYDCFTITALMTLEDYGFCEKGEGGAFVQGGRIELGGELPMNTSGGLLSETGMPGMQLIVEAVRQLRGECRERQVPNSRMGVVSNQGGIMHTHSTLVLRR